MRLPPALVAAAAALILSPPCAAARGWERPVEGPVLRLFSVGPDRFAAGQHRGVDLAAPRGAWVRAACGGRVSFAGRVPRGGGTVSVRCGRLLATYQQLGALTVRLGQAVTRGARIATVGSALPRPHVHLGVREAATGAYVDPLALLAGAPRPKPPPLPFARRPLPLGPPPPRLPVPLRPAPTIASSPARTAGERLPWPVWLGLALFGLGLPLGGLVRLGARRRRAAAGVAQTAS